MNNQCCKCGELFELWYHGQGFICETCHEWGITREEVFPTLSDVLTDQFHRIGKDGAKFWGRLGGGIVFTDGKKILLLQRADEGDFAGYWGIPGGKAKKGELPIDTARRESKEECGENHGQRFGHFDVKNGTHHFHTYLYSVSNPFEVTLSKEHSQSKWVPLDEVEKLQLHPKFKESWPTYHRAIVKQFPQRVSFEEFTAQKEQNAD
jgi:8-oxo-dGTP diphosphatase